MYPGNWANVFPDKAAAIDSATGARRTYGELNDRSNQLAQFLFDKGLRRGDHISIFAENHLAWFDVVWAALRSGLYLTTINRYLTDRATYMIISGGVNIYPQEIENALILHPKVLDVAVIGAPDEEMGEEVRAVVQPTEDAVPGAELEAELIAFARDNLAHYKCPKAVDFRDELPRLPAGKLYKRFLRDEYWGRRGSRIV